MSYRNIYYDQRNKKMILFTWDKNGVPVREEYDYKPWLYVGTTGSKDAVSMFNTPLKKITFNSDFERRKYVKDSGITKFFDNLPTQQQFLVEKFWNINETPEFSKNPLKIAFIDIEVYSPGKFPDPKEAPAPINAITLYNTLDKVYHIWGTKPYTPKQPDMVYHYFDNEPDMLRDFVSFFEVLDIDVFSGFNSESFDIPYIMNRLNNILDESWAKRMSPVGEVYSSEYVNRFGALAQKWKLQGISCIDYLEIYRKLIAKELPSFKLNYIAEIELGEHKLEYEQSNLFDLADNDWETFIDYNIQDVVLLVKLDQKLKYLQVLRLLAYAGLTDMESAMGTTAVTLGGMAIRCKYRDKKLMTFKRNGSGSYGGAFVINPQKGFHEAVVSFDANSLYPNTCITCNVSPETKLGYITNIQDGVVEFQNISGKQYKIDEGKFKKLCIQEKMAVAANNVVYSQKNKGILPEYMDYYYQQRVKVKKIIKDTKKQYEVEKDPKKKHDLQFELDRLDMVQYSLKIQINSAYGALGASFFPAGDTDVAASITATGQAIIKKSYDIADQFAREKGVDVKTGTNGMWYIVAGGDTDSGYLSFSSIFNVLNIKLTESDGVTITKEAYDIVAEYDKYLNKNIEQWARDELYSIDPRIKFGREVIADKAMFLRKKRYLMHVLDNEGNTKPKFKVAGLEIKRTNMPADVKKYASKILENMCMTCDINSTNDVLNETYDYIKTLNESQLAEVSNINGYEKYSSQCNGLMTVKGMPRHVKSAYHYNYILKDLGLTGKYQEIKDGDKIRVLAVDPKQNKYRISAIAFINNYPEEFKSMFKIDYEYMFEKHIYSFVERYYEDCGWVARKPGEMVATDLFSLFGG